MPGWVRRCPESIAVAGLMFGYLFGSLFGDSVAGALLGGTVRLGVALRVSDAP